MARNLGESSSTSTRHRAGTGTGDTPHVADATRAPSPLPLAAMGPDRSTNAYGASNNPALLAARREGSEASVDRSASAQLAPEARRDTSSRREVEAAAPDTLSSLKDKHMALEAEHSILKTKHRTLKAKYRILKEHCKAAWAMATRLEEKVAEAAKEKQSKIEELRIEADEYREQLEAATAREAKLKEHMQSERWECRSSYERGHYNQEPCISVAGLKDDVVRLVARVKQLKADVDRRDVLLEEADSRAERAERQVAKLRMSQLRSQSAAAGPSNDDSARRIAKLDAQLATCHEVIAGLTDRAHSAERGVAATELAKLRRELAAEKQKTRRAERVAQDNAAAAASAAAELKHTQEMLRDLRERYDNLGVEMHVLLAQALYQQPGPA